MKKYLSIATLVVMFCGNVVSAGRTNALIIDHTCVDISQIPAAWVDEVQSRLKWHFAHTSHGRQLLKGLELIEDNDSSFASAVAVSALPTEEGAFCVFDGQEGGDNYIAPKEYWSQKKGMNKTRDVLNHNPAINISQFCWCGELQEYTEAEVQAYLDSISVLEEEFPQVTFVYMTGNAQVQGSEGYNRYLRNEQIRRFCRDNNKVLFDFADLDAWWYNPDSERWEHATYEYDGVTIQTEHPHFNGDEYAHTTLESCEQKGRAVWWMASRLAGWTPGQTVNTPPVALPDSSSCSEDSQCQIDVLSNDSDADGSLMPASVTIVSQPQNGTITEINGATGALTYVPHSDFFGTDTFSYTVADDSGAVSEPAAVYIQVLPVNDAPHVFNLLQPQNGDTLAAVTEPLAFVWRSSQDVDGDTLFYTLQIFNDQADTTIGSIADTLFAFDGAHFFQTGQSYFWTVQAHDDQFSVLSADTFLFVTSPLQAMDPAESLRPGRMELFPNYPNPFNPQTTIRYRISAASHVQVTVYNVLGKKIVTLVNKRQAAGVYRVTFNGKNLSSGIYLCRLKAGAQVKTRKMFLLR